MPRARSLVRRCVLRIRDRVALIAAACRCGADDGQGRGAYAHHEVRRCCDVD